MSILQNDSQEIHWIETNKEKRDSYALWKLCFGDSKEYMDYYFDWRVKENQMLAHYEKDVLTSMVHLNPYPLMIKNRMIMANYIVGVATRPEYRKQGLMRYLLNKSLHHMYQEGQEFTYLMPASEAIYLPFDFRYVYAQQRMKIKWNIKKYLKDIKEEGIQDQSELQAAELMHPIRVQVLNCKDRKELNNLISFVDKKLNEAQDIFASRDDHYYERLQAEMRSAGGDVLLFYQKEKLIGCLSYMLEGNQVEITETIVNSSYSNEVVRTGMHAILGRWKAKHVLDIKDNKKIDNKQIDTKQIESKQKDDKNILEITFLESYYLKGDMQEVIWLQDEITCKEEKKPIIMARIVNLSNFMKHFTAKKPLSLILKVEDPIIKENNRTWKLLFQDESDQYSCQLLPTKEVPEITIGIANLTALFFGYKEVNELYIQGISEETLEKLSNINYFNKIYINEIV